MSDCILWEGSVTNKYGSIWRNGKNIYAHRVAYEQSKGPIPVGLLVRHTCDVKLCVNPEHLILGDDQLNLEDRWERGKPNIGVQHGMAKLTDEIVLQARKLRQEGVSIRELAKKYGVKYQTMVSATNGHTWKHVGGL